MEKKNKNISLEPVVSHDNTSKIGSALQRRLLALKKRIKLAKLTMKFSNLQVVTEQGNTVYQKFTSRDTSQTSIIYVQLTPA